MDLNVFDTTECAVDYAAGYAGDSMGTIGLAPRMSAGLQYLDKIRDTTHSILDVACATGNMFDNLRIMELKADYVGADYSRSMLEKARNLHPAANFVQAGLPRLPFPDNSFDTVFCMSTILFIREQMESALDLFRVARRHVIWEMTFALGEAAVDTVYRAALGGELLVTLPPASFLMELNTELIKRRTVATAEHNGYPLVPEPSGFPNIRSQGFPCVLNEVLYYKIHHGGGI